MMGSRYRLKGGSEWDYLTRWRRYIAKRRGVIAWVKAHHWRRVRREEKLNTKKEARDERT